MTCPVYILPKWFNLVVKVSKVLCAENKWNFLMKSSVEKDTKSTWLQLLLLGQHVLTKTLSGVFFLGTLQINSKVIQMTRALVSFKSHWSHWKESHFPSPLALEGLIFNYYFWTFSHNELQSCQHQSAKPRHNGWVAPFLSARDSLMCLECH